MAELREWLTALTTPVVAALGLWIAYQQLETQKRALRRDVADRRLAILRAVLDLLREAAGEPRPPIEAVDRFNVAIVEAHFLFKPELMAYLEGLRDSYLEIWTISTQQTEEGFGAPFAREQALARRRELRSWMRAQGEGAVEAFRKYLDMSVV